MYTPDGSNYNKTAATTIKQATAAATTPVIRNQEIARLEMLCVQLCK
jgi:hypothetical protein